MSRNTALILRLMARCTRYFWDDECFREIACGPSFKEVQDVLAAMDESNYRLAEIRKYKVMESTGLIQ